MTERIVIIPRNENWETPSGWFVIEYYAGYGLLGSAGIPSAARITDDPEHHELIQVLQSFPSEHVCTQGVCNEHAGIHPENIHMTESIDLRTQGELRPEYYKTESGLEPWDVIKAFRLDYWRGNAVAYLLRAGRKPGDSGGNGAISDIRKAYTFLGERLRMLDEERYPLHVVTIQDAEDEPKRRGPTDVG
jgi:hypothetical protein